MQGYSSGYRLPLYLSLVHAGFPSPADDHLDRKLDLNEHLIPHPAATFFVRVQGRSMFPTLQHGDLLVVDRSLEPRSRDVVLVVYEGELTVKRLLGAPGRWRLVSDREGYPEIVPGPDTPVERWGVVTHAIRSLRRP
ncbi:MAG: LexA family transcriptional regulator [Bacteroidetes bacterium]|nr:MAG: LexA family transcriptional regulator [Bacteroidota bacterium]